MRGVAIVTTVLNEAGTIEGFISSVKRQSHVPDELIIVDGGSSDSTIEVIKGQKKSVGYIKVIEAPGTNISQGRNTGFKNTTRDVIAVTDGGCILDEAWLEHLIEPIAQERADVSYGPTYPILTNTVSRAFASVKGGRIARPSEKSGGFAASPSSRTVAFRRQTLEAAGYYPEWLEIAEDSYLFQRLRDRGARFEFAPKAEVQWEMRTSVGAVAKQFMKYGWGEMLGGTFVLRAFIRAAYFIALPVLILLTMTLGTPVPIWAVVVGWFILPMLPAFIRYRSYVKSRSLLDHLKLLVMIPVVGWTMEVSKLAGSLVGMIERFTPVRILGKQGSRAKKTSDA